VYSTIAKEMSNARFDFKLAEVFFEIVMHGFACTAAKQKKVVLPTIVYFIFFIALVRASYHRNLIEISIA